MSRLWLAAAIAGLAVACGSAYIGPGTTPSPTPTRGLGFDVSVTEKDHAATLRVGQTLGVTLHAGAGMTPWTHPTSSNPQVLKAIVNPAATAVRGVTLAAFQAIAPGEVDVTATSGPLCSPGQPCPMYVALYSLHVTVTG